MENNEEGGYREKRKIPCRIDAIAGIRGDLRIVSKLNRISRN